MPEPPPKDTLLRIPGKDHGSVRFLTFNVNGIKTLFKYYPWNGLRGSVDKFLLSLNADLVSLQELKINTDGVANVGLTSQYRAFILIPKSKKGYSGVALYVRIPSPDEPPSLRHLLTVVKAEEGVTGRLSAGDVPYYKDEASIGGYLSDSELAHLQISEAAALHIDLEGRCCVVELANNTVVFSVYCPANSMGSEEGQQYRLRFLRLLFLRAQNLKNKGKRVVIMGDINVSPDLIDNAEAINELIKAKVVTNCLKSGGSVFEQTNMEECLNFRSSTSHRILLHEFVKPSFPYAKELPTQFLFDSTRVVQDRKLALYTVWNTMTSARQTNYGSRIDLILLSSQFDKESVSAADILPFLQGSDHCPVFTDISVLLIESPPHLEAKKIQFEARHFYRLSKHRDIAAMFSSQSPTPSVEHNAAKADDRSSSDIAPKRHKSNGAALYTTRKATTSRSPVSTGTAAVKQPSIHNFFFRDMPSITSEEAASVVKCPAKLVDVITQFSTLSYEKPPLCHHNDECIMKTSMSTNSKGKKFWCCARPAKGKSDELGEHRCEFFEWTKKPH